MTSQSWNPTANKIFVEALEIQNEHERKEFISHACDNDRGLIDEVNSLIAEYQNDPTFMDEAIVSRTPDPTVSQPLAEIGTTIGPYKLLQQIGEGGFGVVYMAEQKQPVRRKVALKIIKPGMDTKEVISRFKAEQQALAMMNHPNIARVIEAGTTKTGRPYFVMELVKGVPINEFCDENRLSTRERLGLFAEICRAVQHAHQKGIIHRDLKPSNVLVTIEDERPVPKVIDFGVAKAINQELTERTLFTAYGQMVGTPQYMSPEQAKISAIDMDTRSDVYSLGVMFYELLTDSTPLEADRLRKSGFDEMRRLIREEEPPKPSVRLNTMEHRLFNIADLRNTNGLELQRLVRGELDWIAMKAIEKERKRRYQSAGDFALDIGRFLEGLPVQACPPTLRYRMTKFTTRYRSQVAIASLIFFILVISSIVSLRLFLDADLARRQETKAKVEAREQRDAAEHNMELAIGRSKQLEKMGQDLQLKQYIFNVAKAAEAYFDDNRTGATDFLAQCPPEFRNWEWDYLNAQTRADLTTKLPVTALDMAARPFSDQIVILDTSNQLSLINAKTGQQLWSQEVAIPVPCLPIFSPNGKYITISTLWTTPNGQLLVIDADNGRIVWKHEAGKNRTYSMAQFHPREARIVFGGRSPEGSFVELFQYEDDVRIWKRETPAFALLGMSPDGDRLYLEFITGTNPNRPSKLQCWSTRDGTTIWETDRSSSSVPLPTPDGTRLITGGPDYLETRDAMSGKVLETIPSRGFYYGIFDSKHDLLLSRNGRHVSVGPSTNLAVSTHYRIYSVSNGRNDGGVGFTADGKHILTCSGNSSRVELHRVTPAQSPFLLKVPETREIGRVCFSPDGSHLYSVSYGAIRSWSAGKFVPKHSVPKQGGFDRVISVSPDGTLVASGGPQGLRLWDVKTWRLVKQWDGATSWIEFSANGDRIASGGSSQVLSIWDLKNDRSIASISTGGAITGLAFTDDSGQRVVVCNKRGLSIWKDGASELSTIPLESPDSRSVCRLPRSNMVAVGVADRIELWELDASHLVRTCTGHVSGISSLAFHPNGSRLFSLGDDGALKVWDVDTGSECLELQRSDATQAFPGTLAISPDGVTLASAGNKGTIKLWESIRNSIDFDEDRRTAQEAPTSDLD